MSSKANKEQTRRNLVAVGSAFLLHIIIATGFLISHFIFFSDVEEYRGPVLVKLGRADAPDDVPEDLPSQPENQEESQHDTEEDKTPEDEEVKSGEPGKNIAVDESGNENAMDRPVAESENGERGDAQASSEKTGDTSNPVSEENTVAEAEKKVAVVKGREEGNAYETTYEASPGIVGRNFWIPIYMYMPLPQFLDRFFFDSIVGDDELSNRPGTRTVESKQKFLLDYYELLGDEYYLKNLPPKDTRPTIWSYLEDGEYDLDKAEYKEGKTLRPVIITFEVTAGDDKISITGAQVSRSSGFPEIDEAVLYGFLKASFYNSSEESVKGRFTYRFD